MPRKLKEEIERIKGKFPFYIFDQTIIERDLKNLEKAFLHYPTLISYSYKTNYLSPLVKYLDKRNVLSEVVSAFEVEIAEEYGVSFNKIIFNGPVKSPRSIFKILNSGGLVNADSIDDLKLISSIIKENPKLSNIRIGIRIQFDKKGFESRFGIATNKNSLNQVKKILKNLGIDYLSCIHMHYPKRNLKFFSEKLDLYCDFVSKNMEFIHKEKTLLDIGGGLPSEMPNEILESLEISNFSLNDYGKELNKAREKYNLNDMFFLIEPGTCLAANAFHLVGNIHSINSSGLKTYINTDLSNTLLGGLSQKVNFPMKIISSQSKKQKTFYESPVYFAGYTCVENDIFGHENDGIYLNKDDKIMLNSVGSYSAVFKSPFINGDICLYVWDGEKLKLSRREQKAKDIISKYIS